METILAEIQYALLAKFYYMAVAVSLTLPDICAALESQSGKTSGPQYKKWYRDNLAQTFHQMTDDDCYSLRCGVLHQGRFGHAKSQYDRIIFTMPHPVVTLAEGTVMRDIGGLSENVLRYDADWSCKEMVSAARRWFSDMQTDPNVQVNLPRLVRFRQNG